MGRPQVNMWDWDVYHLESAYHDFYRVKRNGVYGTAFVFDKLTQSDLDWILLFKNTVVQTGTCKYAPEIKNARVVLFDKSVPWADCNRKGVEQ